MTGRLLTARVVAELLDVSPATVLRWTRRGTLPAVKLPSGQIRYRADALEEWLERRTTPDRGVLTAADDAGRQDGTLPSTVLTAVPKPRSEE